MKNILKKIKEKAIKPFIENYIWVKNATTDGPSVLIEPKNISLISENNTILSISIDENKKSLTLSDGNEIKYLVTDDQSPDDTDYITLNGFFNSPVGMILDFKDITTFENIITDIKLWEINVSWEANSNTDIFIGNVKNNIQTTTNNITLGLVVCRINIEPTANTVSISSNTIRVNNNNTITFSPQNVNKLGISFKIPYKKTTLLKNNQKSTIRYFGFGAIDKDGNPYENPTYKTNKTTYQDKVAYIWEHGLSDEMYNDFLVAFYDEPESKYEIFYMSTVRS